MYTGEIIDCDVHHARGSDTEFSPIFRRAGANMSRIAALPASFPSRFRMDCRIRTASCAPTRIRGWRRAGF